MKNIEGQVILWNNLGILPNPEGYNILPVNEVALKTDITGTNSGINTGDETQAALLTKLGIPGPFADDTAAATGLVPVGSLYYVTTTLELHTRMA